MAGRKQNHKEDGNQSKSDNESGLDSTPSNEGSNRKQRRKVNNANSKQRKYASTSPKIKSRGGRKCRVTFSDEENKNEASEGDVQSTSGSEAKQLNDFELDLNSTNNTTSVNFREEDNEFVEMEVNDDNDFLSTEEDSENEDDREDGEISFNNNASRSTNQQSENETIMPVPREVELQTEKTIKQAKMDLEREERIVKKTVEKLKEFMTSGDHFKRNASCSNQRDNSDDKGKASKEKGKSGKSGKLGDNCSLIQQNCGRMNAPIQIEGSSSESTIYQGAVKPLQTPTVKFSQQDVQNALNEVNGQRKGEEGSSSEDELINTSDESTQDQINTFLIDVRQNLNGDDIHISDRCAPDVDRPIAIPTTSRDTTYASRQPIRSVVRVCQGPQRTATNNLEQHVSGRIREGDAAKAVRMPEPQGMSQFIPDQVNANQQNVAGNLLLNNACDGEMVLFGPNQFMRTAIMDEDYLIVAAHVDENLERRIRNGEYIDFVRLIPRDRVQMQQDNRIELVNRNGHLSCISVASGSSDVSISSFARWEQAFRVFSNIYTRQFPQRASELIQYNHVIHTAAMTYSWSNVYAYDIDFRLHMSRHPQRSWSVILQQAWNLCLKDRNDHERRSSFSSASTPGKRRDICFRYNAGKCTYGSRCKFDHRCGICGKHGHGAHNCKRASIDKDNWSNDKKYDKKEKRQDRDH